MTLEVYQPKLVVLKFQGVSQSPRGLWETLCWVHPHQFLRQVLGVGPGSWLLQHVRGCWRCWSGAHPENPVLSSTHLVRGQLLSVLGTVRWDDFRFRNLKYFPPHERKTELTQSCLSRPAEECLSQCRVEICFLSLPVFLTRLRWMVIQGREKIWKIQVKTH